MALNKYMHPRNIYKTPPDFTMLVKAFPEFSKIAKADITGKITIDFKDPNSLRVLTKSLLKCDFNLDVDIPEDRLVPTLPLRLNYILWIEDLLVAIQRNSHIKGLDIGTGACAIYPLLAAVKNKWYMIGSEQDEESLLKAQENVKQNSLEDLIQIKKNQTTSVIDHLFSEENSSNFDFCMCNPPFYSSIQELCESRSPARPPPKNGFTGSPQELITDGGELQFCRKLITESKTYKDKIILFTTMVGHKYNLAELIQDLKADHIKYTHTEFCQGRVTRWGLAWTYHDFDIFNLVSPREKLRKKNPPVVYTLPEIPNSVYNLETAFNKLGMILRDLDIIYKVIEKRGNCIHMDILSRKNTWSNQRRKRRLLKRMEAQECKKSKTGLVHNKICDVQDKICHVQDQICNRQDKIDNTQDIIDNAYTMNNSSTEVNLQITSSIHSTLTHENTLKNVDEQNEDVSNIGDDYKPVVHAFFKLLKRDSNILFEMEFLDGNAGKQGLHEIVQYIKNNWK